MPIMKIKMKMSMIKKIAVKMMTPMIAVIKIARIMGPLNKKEVLFNKTNGTPKF